MLKIVAFWIFIVKLTGLQHETKCKEFKMSQRVPATKKIKESSLKGPSLLFSCVPLPHFER